MRLKNIFVSSLSWRRRRKRTSQQQSVEEERFRSSSGSRMRKKRSNSSRLLISFLLIPLILLLQQCPSQCVAISISPPPSNSSSSLATTTTTSSTPKTVDATAATSLATAFVTTGPAETPTETATEETSDVVSTTTTTTTQAYSSSPAAVFVIIKSTTIQPPFISKEEGVGRKEEEKKGKEEKDVAVLVEEEEEVGASNKKSNDDIDENLSEGEEEVEEKSKKREVEEEKFSSEMKDGKENRKADGAGIAKEKEEEEEESAAPPLPIAEKLVYKAVERQRQRRPRIGEQDVHNGKEGGDEEEEVGDEEETERERVRSRGGGGGGRDASEDDDADGGEGREERQMNYRQPIRNLRLPGSAAHQHQIFSHRRGTGFLPASAIAGRPERLPAPYNKLEDWESQKTMGSGGSSYTEEGEEPFGGGRVPYPDIYPPGPRGSFTRSPAKEYTRPPYPRGDYIRSPPTRSRVGLAITKPPTRPREDFTPTENRNRRRDPSYNSGVRNRDRSEEGDDDPETERGPATYFPFPQLNHAPWTPRPLAPFIDHTTEEAYMWPSTKVDVKNSNKRINLQTEYFSLPAIRAPSTTPTTFRPTPRSTSRRPARIPVLVKKLAKRPIPKKPKTKVKIFLTTMTPPTKPTENTTNSDLCSESDIIECANQNNTRNANFGQPALLKFLRGEIWVIPVLVGAGALVVVLFIFEVYLISKSISTNPSRRHLFLGQMLMVGLVLCCGMTVVATLRPTPVTCAVLRLGTGLAYTIIYSTLLVKLVFLISLNSGVYLPATYQCLLLCFAILIQLVIGIQWLVSAPADRVELTLPKTGELYHTCNVTFQQQLLGLLYVIFLVLAVVVLAFKSRGVRENYREAMYIGLTMHFTVCIFITWILAGFFAPVQYQDVCVAGGLVGCAAITFVIMFMPKGRQLSAMGKEGVYAEDRADVYTGSSTQSTGSGGTPSPSFFPIKPGKLVQQFRDGNSKDFQSQHHREHLDTPPSPRKHGKPRLSWILVFSQLYV